MPKGIKGKPLIKCRNCGEMKEHHAKGLCLKCYAKSTPTNRENALRYWREHKEHYKQLNKKYRTQFPERYKEYGRQYSLTHREREWAKASRRHHKLSGHRIQISIDELEELAKQTRVCHICDAELKWNKGKTATNSPTLDRVHNGNIISKETIQIICYRCNLTKLDRTMDEFIDFCVKIANKYRRRLN